VFFKKTFTQLPSGSDVGFAALMAAGNDMGFTVLIAATVSEGQHRDRASRPQRNSTTALPGSFLKKSLTQLPSGNDVGFAALMEAGIDLGFTALMAAAVSRGQHRGRLADRKRNSTTTSADCF
jgi:hypothetical protein